VANYVFARCQCTESMRGCGSVENDFEYLLAEEHLQ
jgi:hypothetical protein